MKDKHTKGDTMKKDGTLTLRTASIGYQITTGKKLPGDLPFKTAARIALDALGWDILDAIESGLEPIVCRDFNKEDGSFDLEGYDRAILGTAQDIVDDIRDRRGEDGARHLDAEIEDLENAIRD